MVWKMVGNNVNYIKFVVNGIKDEKLPVWFFKAANNEAWFMTKLAGGNGHIQYKQIEPSSQIHFFKLHFF